MFKLNMSRHHQGFTLIEVLVAIVIISVFIAVAMQAMLLATVFKTKARQYAEAITWIQEDLEIVKSKAPLPLPSTTLMSAVGSTLVVASSDRFEVGDKLMVGKDTVNNEIQITDPSKSTITLTALLDSIPLPNEPVVVIRSVRCTATSTSTGFANYLQVNLPSSTGEKPILGKKYILTRTPAIKNVAPFEVLQLTYSVAPEDAHTMLTALASATSTTLNVTSAKGLKVGDNLTVGTDTNNTIKSVSGNTITLTTQLGNEQSLGAVVDASIATLNTEVIPDAAFQCPEK